MWDTLKTHSELGLFKSSVNGSCYFYIDMMFEDEKTEAVQAQLVSLLYNMDQ